MLLARLLLALRTWTSNIFVISPTRRVCAKPPHARLPWRQTGLDKAGSRTFHAATTPVMGSEHAPLSPAPAPSAHCLPCHHTTALRSLLHYRTMLPSSVATGCHAPPLAPFCYSTILLPTNLVPLLCLFIVPDGSKGGRLTRIKQAAAGGLRGRENGARGGHPLVPAPGEDSGQAAACYALYRLIFIMKAPLHGDVAHATNANSDDICRTGEHMTAERVALVAYPTLPSCSQIR